MRFSDYIKEDDEDTTAAPAADTTDATADAGADTDADAEKDDSKLVGDTGHADDESAETGDKYDGFQNIQTVAHILAELDEKAGSGDEEGDETNDIKVRLNEALQACADDLEDILESLEKDEDEEDSDEGEESEEGEDEGEGEESDEEDEGEDEEEGEEDEDKE